MDNKVFISYGHDEYRILAEYIRDELKKNSNVVWIDKEEIKTSQDWEVRIEKGIEDSECIILLMTDYSVRRPDGFCLNELSYANANKKQIIPVKVTEIIPPISIIRVQYVDMTSIDRNDFLNNEELVRKVEMIKGVINGEITLAVEEDDIKILEREAIANEQLIDKYSQDFVGREWLFNAYDEWINESESRVFCLVGNAGSGKSAIAARLCNTKEQVKGIHFCVYNDSNRRDAKKIFISLAYHLSSQIPEYAALIKTKNISNVLVNDADTVFQRLFIDYLYELKDYDKTAVIVIDAIDEAVDQNGKNELAKIICSHFRDTPKWLKLVMTTRPEIDVTSRIADLNPIKLDSNVKENDEDIRKYYCKKLGNIDENILQELMKKTAGNFLYAKVVVKDIRDGILRIENVFNYPAGIGNYYLQFFDRIFQSEDNYKDAKRLFSIIARAYEPLKKDVVQGILDMDDEAFSSLLKKVFVLFPNDDEYISPIHKSLVDWLMNKELAGRYYLDPVIGHTLLAGYCRTIRKKKYSLKYAIKHLLYSAKGHFDEVSSLLQDEEYLKLRMEKLGQERTINDYIDEVTELNRLDDEEGEEVYLSATFKEMFMNNEKVLYNFQLYKKLEKNNFENCINSYKKIKDIRMYVGLVKYYYINEKFVKTIDLSDLAEEYFPSKDDEIKMVEIYNAKALSYRKLAKFDECIKICEKICEICHGEYNLYEEAIAHLTLGKIYYHRLSFEEAEMHLEASVSCLEKEREKTDDDNYQHMLTLYIAAFQRELVLMYGWWFKLDKAQAYLQKIEECYTINNSRDRYYVRYLFASLFIAALDKKEANFILLKREMDIYAESRYDKIEVEFFSCLYHLACREEYKNTLDLELEIAGEMKSYFEYNEICLLKNIINGKNAKDNMQEMENEDLQKWIEYLITFINEHIFA